MKIALASDHRGWDTKRHLVAYVQSLGHEAVDLGPEERKPVDYPDYALQVALSVGHGEADRGILICGTGLGMCIAANKVVGVRAAPCSDVLTAELSRRHNDANVLCLSGDLLGLEVVERMVRVWLATEFEGGRHARRVEKIKQFELQNGSSILTQTNLDPHG